MPMNSGRPMTWCSHCGKDFVTLYECTLNTASCINCGKVSFEGAYFESHRRTFPKGNVATNDLVYKKTKVSNTVHYKVLNGKQMLWCPHCVRKGGTTYDHTTASTQCVDCGKILHEDIYTEKATLLHTLRRKDKKKLALDAKRLKTADTVESVGNLLTKKIPANCSYAIRKESAKEDLKTEDEEDSKEEEDSEQESCIYDYNYDYDGGDEYCLS